MTEPEKFVPAEVSRMTDDQIRAKCADLGTRLGRVQWQSRELREYWNEQCVARGFGPLPEPDDS